MDPREARELLLEEVRRPMGAAHAGSLLVDLPSFAARSALPASVVLRDSSPALAMASTTAGGKTSAGGFHVSRGGQMLAPRPWAWKSNGGSRTIAVR